MPTWTLSLGVFWRGMRMLGPIEQRLNGRRAAARRLRDGFTPKTRRPQAQLSWPASNQLGIRKITTRTHAHHLSNVQQQY